MRLPERIPATLLVALLLCAGLQPACADVYSYVGDDGTLNLCNVPVDSRFSVMIADPADSGLAAGGKALDFIGTASDKILYDRIVEEVAQTYGLESALLHAVISVESRYRSNAVSRKGAVGLMQLMPVIARHYGVVDPLDPVQNLHGGAKYLRDLLKKFNNDRSLALAAYNAGERAVVKYGNRIPPYPETTKYVPRVLGYYRKYRVRG